MSTIQKKIDGVGQILKALEDDYGTFVVKEAIKMKFANVLEGER